MKIDPISEVYHAMATAGYESGSDFDQWEKRVQIFHVTETGGIAFVADPESPEIWWLNAYCPNERPDNNTIEFLIELAFKSGCEIIRSEIQRTGSAVMLLKVGFKFCGGEIYERRAD